MADLNRLATLSRAKREFGSLSDAALALYWAALQNGGRVMVDREDAGVSQLVETKMAKTRMTRRGLRLTLTKKAWNWAVPV